MRHKTMAIMLISAILGLLMIAPLNVLGNTSYHGSDYSYEINRGFGNNNIYTCDVETDSNGVFVSYSLSSGGSGSISDGNGSQAGCGVGYNSYYYTGHMTCEDRGWYNSCGDWVNHTTL